MTDALIKERPSISIAVLDDLETGWCDSDHPAIAKLVQWYKDTAPGAQTLSAPGDAEREEILVMIDRRMAAARLLGEIHISISMAWLQKIKDALLRRPVEPVVTDEMVENIARRIAPNNGDTAEIAWAHLTARGEHHQYLNTVRDVLKAYPALNVSQPEVK